MEPSSSSAPAPSPSAGAKPILNAVQRRIVGVLVEKAKTTPDGYPLTLNSLITGCNQKSARDPVTNLSQDQLEEALEQLRRLGAVAEVQGTGRVPKYRHLVYEWLGVDKTEIAVLAELLLRGPQTLGELRGRASRMTALPDLASLAPVVESLKQKGLAGDLTPPGRGQVVTHLLYKDKELDELRIRFASGVPAGADDEPAAAPSGGGGGGGSRGAEVALLRAEVDALKSEVAELRALVERLESRMG